MKRSLALVMIMGIVLMLLGCSDYESSSYSHSANSYKSSSSGKICSYMRPLGNNPDQIRFSEAASDKTCSSGETCTKSTIDLDGDGLLCSQVPTRDGILLVCDGVCK